MKALYFDCFSGISGNMVIGAFLDAGIPLECLARELQKLPLHNEYELVYQRVKKLGISAAYFDVKLPHHHHQEHQHGHHQHRNLQDITEIIENSTLSPKVKGMSLEIFQRLGEAEAKVHNCALHEVHFHEVGAVDAIIDIVGTAFCFHYLGAPRVYASHLHVGNGMVKCSHGLMPVPAPATAELLKGIPFYSGEIKGELVTPTGAAIISTLAREFGPLPPLKTESIAYGAGTWDLPIPNVLRLFVGELVDKAEEEDASTIIETTIDDMNPEFYNYLMEKLFAAGAADVFLTPVYMKKNRPGTLLSVTSNLADHQPLLDIIFTESTTIGVRMYQVTRRKLVRSSHVLETKYGPVRIKAAKTGGKIVNIAPEFEDCRTIARETGIPLKEIYQEAMTLGYKTFVTEKED
ncbi:MAG: nickel pincer cofactor biosynthesis protein LarC [Bacillota bacterium]|uniref:Pyridinium-3,5-bisthiocarboxylic acid mononucleotide nickel insertion protein n=1 Tax=Thermanaerosceptrum fracticalcis TaxID=1712410 RepID=A0A7G6E7Q7_THEFR|nr:nickel pincer cofactor biosynthesis protein LarC [Thermanaerosceptrum fracticalcis]QNB48111.1 nickel pincer cofactor biosynthesis protein LarC [Thermanaerosceptrum fracticalcis]